MTTAIAPKTGWKALNPRKGICRASSTTRHVLATSTANGAQRDPMPASTAAAAEGTATETNSHRPGSTQFESPSDETADIGGVPTPATSISVPSRPPSATNASTPVKIHRYCATDDNGGGSDGREPDSDDVRPDAVGMLITSLSRHHQGARYVRVVGPRREGRRSSRQTVVNRKMVDVRKVCCGRTTVEGKSGRFGASGQRWVSRQKASPWR